MTIKLQRTKNPLVEIPHGRILFHDGIATEIGYRKGNKISYASSLKNGQWENHFINVEYVEWFKELND